MSIGEKLKTQREKANKTQTELSKETGITQQSISRWESGIHTPNIVDCMTLADYYEISIDELIGRSDENGLIKINTQLTELESNVLALFRKITPKEQARVYGMIKAYVG